MKLYLPMIVPVQLNFVQDYSVIHWKPLYTTDEHKPVSVYRKGYPYVQYFNITGFNWLFWGIELLKPSLELISDEYK